MSGTKIAAVGSKTQSELLKYNINPDFVPKEFSFTALVRELSEIEDLKSKSILYPTQVETCHGMSLPVMMIWPIYTANFIETLSDEIINQIKNGIDIATFFSSNTVGCFGVLAEKYNLKKHIQAIAVIGDETAKKAKDIFGKVDIVAKPATEEDLIVGVCHWYA